MGKINLEKIVGKLRQMITLASLGIMLSSCSPQKQPTPAKEIEVTVVGEPVLEHYDFIRRDFKILKIPVQCKDGRILEREYAEEVRNNSSASVTLAYLQREINIGDKLIVLDRPPYKEYLSRRYSYQDFSSVWLRPYSGIYPKKIK